LKRSAAWRVAVAVTVLVSACVVTEASWIPRLRVIPSGFGLKPRILFQGCDGSTGQLYDLQFAFYNPTDEDVTIDWDASSLQLPEGRDWHVVQPEVAGEGSTTVVPARSSVTVRVCPDQARNPRGGCDQSWLHPTLFSDGASLRLRLALLSGSVVQTREWIWDFHYVSFEPDKPSGLMLDSSLLPIVLLVAAVAFVALVLLL